MPGIIEWLVIGWLALLAIIIPLMMGRRGRTSSAGTPSSETPSSEDYVPLRGQSGEVLSIEEIEVIIRRSIPEFNALRAQNQNARLNLRGINLSHAKLGGINLHGITLRDADLSYADFTQTTDDTVDATFFDCSPDDDRLLH